MKTQRKMRIFASVFDCLFLLAGSIAAVAFGAAGTGVGERFLWASEVLAIAEMCFFGLFVVIETISMFKISDSTYHTVLIAVFLLCFHFTGYDFLRIIFDEGSILVRTLGPVFHFAFFCLTAIALLFFWDHTFALKIPRALFLYAVLSALVALALYAILFSYGLQTIAFALFLLLLGVGVFLVLRRMDSALRCDKTFIVSEAFLYALAGSQLTSEICRALHYSESGVLCFHAIPIILVFLSIYAAFAMRTDREALKASEYKLQYERIKARALKEQIKPHFIFNTLAAIQSLYRIGTKEGDRAVTLLSGHLRTNIEAADTDFIPFEKELDNVQVLVDLENMRLGNAFNIIYDIDYADFEVPILSLQPYIENAIKYSRVNEKEDGYILISTRLEGDNIILTVTDNGVGFDPAAVKPTSCGIRNSSERFSMLMGVTPEIESAPGKGTTVRICLKNSTPPHSRYIE